jgi:hypothetical protein
VRLTADGDDWIRVHRCMNRIRYTGINEALFLAQAELLNPHLPQDPRTPRKMVIFTDNQAAIQSCHHPTCASGQYIVRTITRKIDTLR